MTAFFVQRLHRVDHSRQRPVFHLDIVKCVFGGIAVDRTDDGNRLSDKAHAVHRDAVVLHRCIDGKFRLSVYFTISAPVTTPKTSAAR